MSAITRIEQALLRLDGAAYQKLCDVYLRREGYRDLEPFGSRPGANKTRKGTPDSYVTLPNGQFVFVEYTTQQDHTFEKLLADLAKCLDSDATGVQLAQVAEIIQFHTGRLAPAERAALIARASAANVLVRPISLEQLAYDLRERHQALVYDMLGIELDTRQLLTVDDFVVAASASKFATTLDVPFRFRQADIATATTSLRDGTVVLLTGDPGIGKTRLALEVCRVYQASRPDTLVRCLFNRSIDLYHELQQLLASPAPILLFVDDANRFGGLDALLQLVEESHIRAAKARDDASRGRADGNLHVDHAPRARPNDESDQQPRAGTLTTSAAAGTEPAASTTPRVTLLLTVRGYAREHVRTLLRQRGRGAPLSEVELGRLTDTQIAELLEEVFSIRNSHFVERIQAVARGNPRLAMMAGRIAVDEQSLAAMDDVTTLYDQYFESIRRDLSELASRRTLVVAACIALFRAVDGENERQMASISQLCGVSPEEFWQEAQRLHEMEVVDLHGETAAKISDQVLGTYLLYLAVFRTRTLSAEQLLDSTFRQFRTRLMDALGGLLNAFDTHAIIDAIRPAVDGLWTAASSADDPSALDAVMEAFWFVRPDQTLAEIARWVESLPPAHEASEVGPHHAPSGSPSDSDLRTMQDAGADVVEPPRHSLAAEVPPAPLPLLRPIRADEHATLPSRLMLLPVFRRYSAELTRLAAAVACDYLEKRPDHAGGVVHLLGHGFGVRHDSPLYGFVAERAVVDEVTRRIGARDGLFARVAVGLATIFLRLTFESTSSSERAISLRRFEFDANREGTALRETVWRMLTQVSGLPTFGEDVRLFLAAYARGLERHTFGRETAARIVAADAPHVLALLATLDSRSLPDCVLARDVMAALSPWGVRTPLALNRRFRHHDLRMVRHLFGWWHVHRPGDWEDLEQRHVRALRAVLTPLSLDAFQAFFESVERVHAVARARNPHHNDWFAQNRLTRTLTSLAAQRPADYRAILECYVTAGESLGLAPGPLLHALIDATSVPVAAEFVGQLPVERRVHWEAAYLAVISGQQIVLSHADRIVQLFESAPLTALPGHWQHIVRLRAADPTLLRRITSVLVDRASCEPAAGQLLTWLFTGIEQAAEVLREDFAHHPELLVRAYLVADGVRAHFDHDAAVFDAVTDLDPAFPTTYVDHVYADPDTRFRFDEHRDYARLWQRKDSSELATRVAKRVVELERQRAGVDSWLAQLFVQRRESAPAVEAAQDSWLAMMIAAYATDPEMMEVVFGATTNLRDERRRLMFASLLANNTSLECFQRLPFEPWMRIARESWVPVEERRRAFLDSLLPLCNRPALLGHREYLLQLIAEGRQRIAAEKKRDFLS